MKADAIGLRTIQRIRGNQAIKHLPETRRRLIVAMHDTSMLMFRHTKQRLDLYLDALRNQNVTDVEFEQLETLLKWFAANDFDAPAPEADPAIEKIFGAVWFQTYKAHHADAIARLKELFDAGGGNDDNDDLIIEGMHYQQAIRGII